MYGMVNEGIRTFIETHHGSDTWTAICQQAGVQQAEFERMANYDDAVTYDLVGAICAHTGMPAAKVLEVFGTYWVEFAGQSSFGKLLTVTGKDFVERVEGLDDMHERILVSMPHLKPPSFDIEQTGDTTYQLHYYSERDGLAPMVIGLLHGLAAQTGEKISVKMDASKMDGADHDIFAIDMLE